MVLLTSLSTFQNGVPAWSSTSWSTPCLCASIKAPEVHRHFQQVQYNSAYNRLLILLFVMALYNLQMEEISERTKNYKTKSDSAQWTIFCKSVSYFKKILELNFIDSFRKTSAFWTKQKTQYNFIIFLSVLSPPKKRSTISNENQFIIQFWAPQKSAVQFQNLNLFLLFQLNILDTHSGLSTRAPETKIVVLSSPKT